MTARYCYGCLQTIEGAKAWNKHYAKCEGVKALPDHAKKSYKVTQPNRAPRRKGLK